MYLPQSTLQGIGTATALLRSSKVLKWKDEEGHEGWFQPFILDHLPINLWGRDVLMKMGAIITTQPVQNMLDKQGYIPGKGLEKYLQGKPLSVSEESLVLKHPKDKTGLGNLS